MAILKKALIPEPPASKPCRPGGRSERVVRRVLDATATELAARGYVALRIEDVAAKAGVNKTTVYRRWPTKADLVAATFAAFAEPSPSPCDEGTLEDQLVVLALEFGSGVCTEKRISMGRLMSNEAHVPEVAAIMKSAKSLFKAPWIAVVRRAIARGDLPVGTSEELLVDTLVSVLAARLFRDRESIDATYVRTVLSLLLTGARAGGAVAPKVHHTKKATARVR